MPPNPSLEATVTGKALGPRARGSYHRSRGPSAFPAPAPQLKRYAPAFNAPCPFACQRSGGGSRARSRVQARQERFRARATVRSCAWHYVAPRAAPGCTAGAQSFNTGRALRDSSHRASATARSMNFDQRSTCPHRGRPSLPASRLSFKTSAAGAQRAFVVGAAHNPSLKRTSNSKARARSGSSCASRALLFPAA